MRECQQVQAPPSSWPTARRRRSPPSSASSTLRSRPVVLNQPPSASSQNRSSCRRCSVTAHSSHAGSPSAWNNSSKSEDQVRIVLGIRRRWPRRRRDSAGSSVPPSASHSCDRMNSAARAPSQIQRAARAASPVGRPPEHARRTGERRDHQAVPRREHLVVEVRARTVERASNSTCRARPSARDLSGGRPSQPRRGPRSPARCTAGSCR